VNNPFTVNNAFYLKFSIYVAAFSLLHMVLMKAGYKPNEKAITRIMP